MLKDRKLLILPTLPLEFLDETYPAKTRNMALSYGEKVIILTSTAFLRYNRLTSDRQTGDSIYVL